MGAKASEIMGRRYVDFVILRIDSGEEKHLLKVEGDTMVPRIVTDHAPEWLSKVALTDGRKLGFRMYRFAPAQR